MSQSDEIRNREEILEQEKLASILASASLIPPGSPGECDMCGEWSGRLVGAACAPCRDKYKLP